MNNIINEDRLSEDIHEIIVIPEDFTGSVVVNDQNTLRSISYFFINNKLSNITLSNFESKTEL